MIKYQYLIRECLQNLPRQAKSLWHELVLSFILFLSLNVLFQLSNIFGAISKLLSSSENLPFSLATANPQVMFFNLLKSAMLFLSFVLLVYLAFFFKNFITKELLLHKENLQHRYQQILDKKYILAPFFIVPFLLFLMSLIFSHVVGFLVNIQILQGITTTFSGLKGLNNHLDFLILLAEFGGLIIIFMLLFLRRLEDRNLFK